MNINKETELDILLNTNFNFNNKKHNYNEYIIKLLDQWRNDNPDFVFTKTYFTNNQFVLLWLKEQGAKAELDVKKNYGGALLASFYNIINSSVEFIDRYIDIISNQDYKNKLIINAFGTDKVKSYNHIKKIIHSDIQNNKDYINSFNISDLKELLIFINEDKDFNTNLKNYFIENILKKLLNENVDDFINILKKINLENLNLNIDENYDNAICLETLFENLDKNFDEEKSNFIKRKININHKAIISLINNDNIIDKILNKNYNQKTNEGEINDGEKTLIRILKYNYNFLDKKENFLKKLNEFKLNLLISLFFTKNDVRETVDLLNKYNFFNDFNKIQLNKKIKLKGHNLFSLKPNQTNQNEVNNLDGDEFKNYVLEYSDIIDERILNTVLIMSKFYKKNIDTSDINFILDIEVDLDNPSFQDLGNQLLNIKLKEATFDPNRKSSNKRKI